MIATQREALEAARKSREDALKATKVWLPFGPTHFHSIDREFIDQEQLPGVYEPRAADAVQLFLWPSGSS